MRDSGGLIIVSDLTELTTEPIKKKIALQVEDAHQKKRSHQIPPAQEITYKASVAGTYSCYPIDYLISDLLFVGISTRL